MAEQERQNEFLKGILIGSLAGGAIGAIVGLLLAPKSGEETRKLIVDTTSDIYKKTADYIVGSTEKVKTETTKVYNEAKEKASEIVTSAKTQAEELINRAESVLQDAKERAAQVQTGVKSGVEAFKSEIKDTPDEN
ncbi:MAG: YtxH domain-containing protein [Candidatus Kapabacteria bacterium]|nr:YtxH domain-containing protein [Candidatus Kapabacteria bacterium]